MTPRIVITGRGVITPVGHNVDDAWQMLCDGTHGLAPLGPGFSELPIQWAGQIRDFDPSVAIPSRRTRRSMDRRAILAVVAGAQALREAGLLGGSRPDPARLGVALAANHPLVDLPELETALRRQPQIASSDAGSLHFASKLPPLGVVTRFINMATSHMAAQFDLQGPSATPTGDGAAGAHAVGIALRWLRLGIVDAVLVGGVDAQLDPFHLGVLAQRPEMFASGPPGPSTGPFGAKRRGGYPGEAAACLVLESLERARARGAEPIAEVVGYGAATATEWELDPGPDRALIRAVHEACGRVVPTRDCPFAVYAAGIGSPRHDRAEAVALKTLGYGAKVTSLKGACGNTLAASAPVDLVMATQTLSLGVLPPTVGAEERGTDCDLDLCIRPEKRDYRWALVHAMGFRGPRSAVLLGAPP